MADVDISIAGRQYRIACRDGEEDNLRRAAAMVDAKSREALAGLGSLSEARQFLFASLLLADQIVEGAPAPAPLAQPTADPATTERVERLAQRLESLAGGLERAADRT